VVVSGDVTAVASRAVGVHVARHAAELINSGTITVHRGVLSTSEPSAAVGLDLSGVGSAASITNTGRIDAGPDGLALDMRGSAASLQLTNSGTLSGHIQLGEGDVDFGARGDLGGPGQHPPRHRWSQARHHLRRRRPGR